MNLSRLLGATALVGAFSLLPTLALAQAVPDANSPPVNADGTTPTQTTQGDETGSQEILVTGSRIRRANDESPNPITTVTAADIFASGRVSIGDVLNDLPQLRSTVSSQNSTSGLGVRGLNLLDLRGLGTSRTLVLVNGRRHVSSEIINNGNSPDINTFPTDLIEKIDIVSGGNSAVYGSDAIAGVVNFILKENYDGLDLHGQTGISKYGDAGNQYLSAVAGKNFADGRGNIAVNLEYAHQQDYYAPGRPNLRQNDAFVVVDTDPAGSVNGSDSIPDHVFVRDIRSTTISTGGQVGIRYANTATAPCGVDSAGSSFTCAYLFQPGGALAPQTGTRIGLGPNGSFTGGNGYIGREGRFSYCRRNSTGTRLTSSAISKSALPSFRSSKPSMSGQKHAARRADRSSRRARRCRTALPSPGSTIARTCWPTRRATVRSTARASASTTPTYRQAHARHSRRS